ncbi:MAG: endolytic transglycosylase MltG [Bacteriovoracaceae bacterium]|nr:endolytic transglycosylase MltG [Bacteriovoracaceae bacterium]
MKKIFFILFLAPFISLLMISAHLYYLLHEPYQGDKTHFTVKRGESFQSVKKRLYEEGFIKTPRVLDYYARYKGLAGSLKTGSFTLHSGSNPIQILNTLVFGKADLIAITIPEGKNIYEIAQILQDQNICKAQDFLQKAKDFDFVKTLPTFIPLENWNTESSLEGYLYPETYYFMPEIDAEIVIKAMLAEFDKKIKKIVFPKSNFTKHQIITFASIVEKETGARFEKKKIAGVFHNRLQKKMMLQSDPTTIYGLRDKFLGNIKKGHLQLKTPYNTYTLQGLPIGPICNPSIETIDAVLFPEKHDLLFFVSKNDGTHLFSADYQTHLENIKKFQKNPKNREGKSWRNLKQ